MKFLGGWSGVLFFAITAPLGAQTVAPAFSGSYSLTSLGSVSGVPANYGGLVFKAGDPNTILIGGQANIASGLFYTVPVNRGAGNHITSFGAASALGFGTHNDGGVAYGPGGVLFYSEYSNNEVGEVKPGSNADDKTVDLSALGIASSTGALNFVPAGYPGAGQLKISSWSGGQFYNVTFSPDGSGTYDLNAANLQVTLPGGPEGFVYVPHSSPLFVAQSMLVSEYSSGSVAAYTIDANGNPILGSRQDFITGLTGAEGAAIDPLTGDFLFSTYGGGNQVIEVQGFAVPRNVTDAFQVRYASNLGKGDAFIDITNTGASATAAQTQPVPNSQFNINGSICANIYAFAADEQEVSCCSCLITPNGLYSLSVENALLNSLLTSFAPNELVVKLIATVPASSTDPSTGLITQTCNPATAGTTTGGLANGLLAWGTSTHGFPTATGPNFQLTETPFLSATLSTAELTRDVQECQFIQILGSGQFGMCKGCQNAGLGAAAQ